MTFRLSFKFRQIKFCCEGETSEGCLSSWFQLFWFIFCTNGPVLPHFFKKKNAQFTQLLAKWAFKWKACQRWEDKITSSRLMIQQNLKQICKFWILKGLINQGVFFQTVPSGQKCIIYAARHSNERLVKDGRIKITSNRLMIQQNLKPAQQILKVFSCKEQIKSNLERAINHAEFFLFKTVPSLMIRNVNVNFTATPPSCPPSGRWRPSSLGCLLVPGVSGNDYLDFGNGNSSAHSQILGTGMGMNIAFPTFGDENCIPYFW